MSQVASDSLLWIKTELDNTLLRGRQLLEGFVENPEEKTHLENCLECLHQVQGTLRMVEVYGAAMLAEEMEAVALALKEGKIEDKDPAFESLMRAMLQLPDYLERIVHGQRDVPLALLSLLNELRSVRGEKLLSESALFAQSLSGGVKAIKPEDLSPAGGDIVAAAKKLRPKFQASLLGWFKSDESKHLKALQEIANELEQTATIPSSFQLWWVLGGVLEALDENGIEASVSLKQMLGQVDRQIKRLIDEGESVFESAAPTELVNNLLFYVGKADSSGERVAAIKESYGLGELIPTGDQVDKARDSLAGPNINLMKTVSAAVKEDLSRVKDTLDIFVRMGKDDAGELSGPAELLKKIADTLAVLGLGTERDEIEAEREALENIASGKNNLTESALMDVAASLIKVETTLDERMVELVFKGSGGAEIAEEDDSNLHIEEADFKQVSAAVVRESIINLARVKDSIVEFIKNPSNTDALRPIPPLVHQIQSGLRLLDVKRPAELLESVRAYIQKGIFSKAEVPPQEDLDRMADAIVSVEFYLETMQQGRGFPESMLDNAEACVEALGFPVGALDSVEDGDIVEIQDDTAEETGVAPAQDAEDVVQLESEPASEPEKPKPAVGPKPEDVDPEIVEIFLEEAQEEIASLKKTFPRWKQTPGDEEALGTMRRSFHTLKGSGRMVGAELIGEFAWSMENVLNRVIDETIDVSPEVLALLEQSIDTLPQLTEQFEAGTDLTADVDTMMETAHAMSRGEHAPKTQESVVDAAVIIEAVGDDIAEAAEPVKAEEPAKQAETKESAKEDQLEQAGEPEGRDKTEEAPAMSPILYDIFKAEVGAHLELFRSFVDEAEQKGTPRAMRDDVLRALHTLSGSAAMAGVFTISELVDPFERYCKELAEDGQKLEAENFEVFKDLADVVEKQLVVIKDNGPNTERLDEMTTKVRQLLISAESSAKSADKISAKPEADTKKKTSKKKTPKKKAAAPKRETKFVKIEELTDFDPDIASIYFEEAAEILEMTDASLQSWSQNQDKAPLVTELQRHLHTLKGGARMAGITPMGDLSHEMESLLTEVVDGRMPVSTGMFALMQRAIDRLHRMLEQVCESKPIIDAQDLVVEIRGFQGGEGEINLREQAVSEPDAEPESTPTSVTQIRDEEPTEYEEGEDKPQLREREPGEAFDPNMHTDQRETSRMQHEIVRVRADLIENLINHAGEVSIFRSRLEQQLSSLNFHLTELDQTVVRLREQLRRLEIETEAQIFSQYEQDNISRDDEFDPLELDRYSTVQQLSRALAESVNDLVSIQGLLINQARESETLLLQQARVNTELQDGLMRTRMVPFSRHGQRLRRIVRQIAEETGKQAELTLFGAEGEMDRQVLERVLAPLEHMMRNSIVHGIESPQERKKAKKPEQGEVKIQLHREGSEVVITVSDDGRGLNIDAIRDKALATGLIREEAQVTDDDLVHLILESGFSTAEEITQSAGRGVGMDVVASEIKQLGGTLTIENVAGKGAKFTIRLPFTLAISNALVVNVAEESYAIPLSSIEGIVRVPRKDLDRYFVSDNPTFSYGGQEFHLQHLGVLLGLGAPQFTEEEDAIPVLLVRVGNHASAIVTEGMQGSREIVVKSVGPQISGITGISGATILGDGSILVILDVNGLVRQAAQLAAIGERLEVIEREEEKEEFRTFAMVVDDSITVRRVTQRLLERYGMRVMTAKDGVDALALLQENMPDVMLLDIEMPRMDGYELASHMRNDDRFKEIPIIMITSRTGEKHRKRAMELGVNKYLGKPYQEGELVEHIQALVGKFNPERTRWD